MLEVFEKQFIQALRYGMTYNQFWVDEPELYYIYEQAHKEELEDRLREKDISNWQLGQYIKLAICASFDDKQRCKYPNEPVFFAKQEKKLERPKNAKEMREYFRNHIKPLINKKL